MNWSGGKDATLALYQVLQQKEIEVAYLMTTLSAELKRITMHGVREELLTQQAASIGIPLHKIYLPKDNSMSTYNDLMQQTLTDFQSAGIQKAIFGDIFLEDLRQYREAQLAKVGWEAIFPIWQQPTDATIRRFIDLGFKAITVCVNAKHLDQSFVGRQVDHAFVEDLPKEVDPCGENGEFHTFVYDGPIFSTPISFEVGEVVQRDYGKEEETNYDTRFYFVDLLPK